MIKLINKIMIDDYNNDLEEKTIPKLHNYLFEIIKKIIDENKYKTALDLGCGSGAFAMRLKKAGLQVECADINKESFAAKDIKFYSINLNDLNFSEKIIKKYDLIISIEVIEHLYSPLGFLRNLCNLLNKDGSIVITTPNVDSIANRIKFLLTSDIRMFDKNSDPEHISPIFHKLLIEKYLPKINLKIENYYYFPHEGFYCSRAIFRIIYRLLSYIPIFQGDKLGDISIFHLMLKNA